MTTRVRLLRCWLVWLGVSVLAAAVIAVVAGDAAALLRSPGADLELALVRVGSAVLLGCAAWGWAATTTVVLLAARGRVDRPVRGVPHAWRRAVLLACGVALTTGLGGPAGADADLSGLPLPDRATGAPAVSAPSVSAPAVARSATRDRLVVRPGDSLWRLAARELGPGAAPDAVDRHWRRLYRLNRAALGADPDLIRPGQQLRLPPPPQERP